MGAPTESTPRPRVDVLEDAGLRTGGRELERLIAQRGALVLRGVVRSSREFVALLASLGESMTTAGETEVPGHPTLNVVTNVGRTRPPRSVFHTDTSYDARPPAITALRAIEAPTSGGETLVSDQRTALATLPCATRALVARRSMAHRASGVPESAGPQPTSWHPVVRRHPITGDLALFISTPERCEQISGLTRRDSQTLVRRLYTHSTRPALVKRHRWRAGDVLLIDDRITMHRADHSAVSGPRVMHRGLVRGESPLAADASASPARTD